MTTYVIETGEVGVMLTVDGGEPQQLESVEAACEMIELAEGVEEPEAMEEAEAFGAATDDQMPPMRKAPAKQKPGMRAMSGEPLGAM